MLSLPGGWAAHSSTWGSWNPGWHQGSRAKPVSAQLGGAGPSLPRPTEGTEAQRGPVSCQGPRARKGPSQDKPRVFLPANPNLFSPPSSASGEGSCDTEPSLFQSLTFWAKSERGLLFPPCVLTSGYRCVVTGQSPLLAVSGLGPGCSGHGSVETQEPL